MSTGADIVERIEAERTARAGDPLRPANPLLREAAAEITKLRAERDAAARDMRKRCKAVADADVRLCERMQHDAATADIASRWAVCKQTAEKIGNAIAALPDAVIATDGETNG